MKTLLIGGAHDGQWFEIDIGRPWFDVPVVPLSGTPIESTAEVLQVERYERVGLTEDTRLHYVYVNTKMKPGEVIKSLIEGYRKP